VSHVGWLRAFASGTLPEECVVWPGCKDRDGYGTLKCDGRMQRAHRAAFEIAYHQIPDGLQIDHLCRNRSCVNPRHLDLVSLVENTRRGYWGTRTACKWGHAYTPQNTLIYPSRRGRRCRTCWMAYRARRRAAAAA
jgi:hypothetical protein